VGLNVSREINCRAWVVMCFIFGYLSFGFASALIILRVIALWNWNKGVIAFASVSWLTNACAYVYSLFISPSPPSYVLTLRAIRRSHVQRRLGK